jgi:hypothetical protein
MVYRLVSQKLCRVVTWFCNFTHLDKPGPEDTFALSCVGGRSNDAVIELFHQPLRE